jgi:hypothetical protein
MSRDTRGTELWDYHIPMGQQLGEPSLIDPRDQLVRSESSFTSRTPHVDSTGVEDENPEIEVRQT